LAYLDDTLEPTEIKQIGQKVAESDAAQELIARIKQITRRRRLTTPPSSGPGAANFDPNTVAEYLDNALSGDQIAEVERLCLESDVHLAEISTCHQILTLVLGEPALVPPTARERMYGLVQGKESIPFRKAPNAAPTTARAASTNVADGGDESSPGFGIGRRGGWSRWALPAAGVLLIVGLTFTLIKVLPGGSHGRQVASNSIKKTDVETPAPPETEPKDKAPAPSTPTATIRDDKVDAEKVGEKAIPVAAPPTTAKPNSPTAVAALPKESKPAGETAAVTPPPVPAASTERVGQPSTERREIGTYTVAPRSGPTLLVQRDNAQAPWRRLTPGSRVASTAPVVSLPGFLSDVRLDSGVQLQLRGLVPQFATDRMMAFLSESAVVLHPSRDVDLDFTLNRGRVYVSNHKEQGPAKVRIRFGREIWELTLAEPDAEAIIEIIRRYTGDIRWQDGEEPWTGAYLAILKGKGALTADYRVLSLEMPGPAFCLWDNKGRGLAGPNKLPKAYPQWEKTPPATKEADEMTAALEDLSKRMVDKKSVDIVLVEGLQSDKLSQRFLSIYCLGALDEVRRLLDVLGEEDPNHGPDRNIAGAVLQNWLSRGPQMSKELYDPATRAGLLTENRKYLSGEAETILKLLYGFNVAELRSADTYRVLADYLLSPKVAIRELAFDQLWLMGARLKFDPTAPEAERQKIAAEVNKMVDDHKLPPPLQQPNAAAADQSGKAK
jgi:hypothetical protein